jgi:uncharacterized membrane protein YgaE (UPF0421/DUF939 family)
MRPMSLRALAISAVAVTTLVVGGMLFGLSFERAAFLAPVLVIVGGGVAFLVVLWAKVIRDSLRGRG